MKNRLNIYLVILATALIPLLGIASNSPSNLTYAGLGLVLYEAKDKKAGLPISIPPTQEKNRLLVRKANRFNDPLWKGNK